MTAKEHLSKHDREIAEIRAIQKRTEANLAKHAAEWRREAAEIWELMGKLAKGTEAAQKETIEIRREVRELSVAVRALVQSMRSTNGHRKR